VGCWGVEEGHEKAEEEDDECVRDARGLLGC
jgi:hypothetical protein